MHVTSIPWLISFHLQLPSRGQWMLDQRIFTYDCFVRSGKSVFQFKVGSAVNSIEYGEHASISDLEKRSVDCQHLWFQKDGAMSHIASASMVVRPSLFPNCLISRFGDVLWTLSTMRQRNRASYVKCNFSFMIMFLLTLFH